MTIMNKLLTSLIVTLLLCGCGNASSNDIPTLTIPPSSPITQQPEIYSQSTNHPSESVWQVKITNVKLATDLSTKQIIAQYNGSMVEVPQEQSPTKGSLFLLLELLVEKQGVGRATFSWKDTYILDEAGNKYYRHENDTFLDVQNFKRLKATDIKLGTSQGYVCYEIPENIISDSLWLVNNSDSTEIKIKVNLQDGK